MKKFLTLGLAVAMSLSFAACNANNGEVEDQPLDDNQIVEQDNQVVEENNEAEVVEEENNQAEVAEGNEDEASEEAEENDKASADQQ